MKGQDRTARTADSPVSVSLTAEHDPQAKVLGAIARVREARLTIASMHLDETDVVDVLAGPLKRHGLVVVTHVLKSGMEAVPDGHGYLCVTVGISVVVYHTRSGQSLSTQYMASRLQQDVYTDTLVSIANKNALMKLFDVRVAEENAPAGSEDDDGSPMTDAQRKKIASVRNEGILINERALQARISTFLGGSPTKQQARRFIDELLYEARTLAAKKNNLPA